MTNTKTIYITVEEGVKMEQRITNLITEARELSAIDIEEQPIHAEVIIDELCDALEKAQKRIELLEGAIDRQNKM